MSTKRFYTLLFAVWFSTSLTAQTANLTNATQNVDKLQPQCITSIVDSLSQEVNKLKHDFDFLFCEYKLNQRISELDMLSHSIDIASNKIMTDLLLDRYDDDLSLARSKWLESIKSNYNAQKEAVQSVKVQVALKILTTNFTKEELDVIDGAFRSIERTYKVIESSLQVYEITLGAYYKLK